MYTRVGTYEKDPQPLIDLTSRFRMHVNKRGYATTFMDQERSLAVFQPLLGDVFPGEWSFVMLSMIVPEGHIHLHTDAEAELAGAQRLHLVLKSNPRCWNYSADVGWQQLEQCGIYTFDPSIEHASVNLGTEPRLHFVVDVKGPTP